MNIQNIPILLAEFNKPEKAQQLIASLGTLQSRYTSIATDGPHAHVEGEEKCCTQAYKIVTDGSTDSNCFSKIANSWGWVTWRQSCQNYILKIVV